MARTILDSCFVLFQRTQYETFGVSDIRLPKPFALRWPNLSDENPKKLQTVLRAASKTVSVNRDFKSGVPWSSDYQSSSVLVFGLPSCCFASFQRGSVVQLVQTNILLKKGHP